MPDKPTPPASGTGTVLPRRSPGHRGQDQSDAVAAMIAKAHEISLEAGSKMATAMKDVIFAAAGLTPFAVDSAKDLINYMVRRGQMSADEADRIIRDIEVADDNRRPAGSKSADVAADAAPKKAAAKTAAAKAPAAKKDDAPAKAPAAKKAAAKKAAAPKAAAPKAAAPKAAAPAAKKAAPKKK